MPRKPLKANEPRKKQLGTVAHSGSHKGTFTVTGAELQKISGKMPFLDAWHDKKKKTKVYRLIDWRKKKGNSDDRKQT